MNKKLIKVLSLLIAAVLLLCACGAAVPQSAPVYEEIEIEEIELPEEIWELLTEETGTPEAHAPPAETEPAETVAAEPEQTEPEALLPESGEYTSRDEVALYIHLYGHLPGNYITKKQAQNLGWVSKEGNLHKVAPGKSIGGDYFGNYEGLLPTAPGRKYTECDIDYVKGTRNAKRIIFSNDGLIYYTEDHYQTFELLYGEE